MNVLEICFRAALDASWRGGCLVLVLAALGRLLRGRAPSRLLFAAWIVCSVRLLIPLSASAAWSPFNLAHLAARAPGVTELPARANLVPAADIPAGASPSLPSGAVGAISLPELAAGVWIAGVAALVAVRLVLGWRFSRRVRSSLGAQSAGLTAAVAQVAAELGLRPVGVALTDAVAAPAVSGLARPNLLFPRGFAERLTPEELRSVIAHELGHCRYRDLAALTLVRAAAMLHWFNPLAWAAVRLARYDCEAACDEFVLGRLQGPPERYGEILLKTLQLAAPSRLVAPVLAIVGSRKQVRRRIKMIASFQSMTARRIVLGGALLALGLAAGFTREARAQSVPAAATSPAPATNRAPKGWWKNGSRPDDYMVGLDQGQLHEGHASAFVRSLRPKIDGFGGMMQEISAEKYLGKRIRYSAWVKTADANNGGAHLWMRIDGDPTKSEMVGFDNMDRRPVKGTSEWKQYSLVLDVPASSIDVAYGFFVQGAGQMWVSGVSFEEVGSDVPTTNMDLGARGLPKDPVNLDFGAVSVHLRMIQLKRHSGETDAELLARADQIVALFRGGERFADLARSYTEDGRATKAGDWGWVSAPDLKPMFGQIVFALAPGAISAPCLSPDPADGCFLFYNDRA